MIPGQSMALGAPAVSPNGTAPRCEHLDGLVPAGPQSVDCRECRNRLDRQAGLVVCLTCGWVACSDDSPNQHARAHYEMVLRPPASCLIPRGVTGPVWAPVLKRSIAAAAARLFGVGDRLG
jgi:hypothetical protein